MQQFWHTVEHYRITNLEMVFLIFMGHLISFLLHHDHYSNPLSFVIFSLHPPSVSAVNLTPSFLLLYLCVAVSVSLTALHCPFPFVPFPPLSASQLR